MPVLLQLSSFEDVFASKELLSEAFSRVELGTHAVALPNDRFKERPGRPW
jgi:hypothetical protein